MTLRPHLSRSGLGVFLVAVALLACKKKEVAQEAPAPAPAAPASASAEDRKVHDDVKALIAKFAGFAKVAKTQQPVRRDRPFATKVASGEYLLVGVEWLADPHAERAPDALELESTVLSLCSYAARSDEPKEDSLKYAKECLAWKYVAALRAKKIAMPKVNLATKSFTPGSVEGDLFLFDVGTSKIVGRYEVSITNSDELTYQEGQPESAWQTIAGIDLRDNVRAVVEQRLAHERESMAR